VGKVNLKDFLSQKISPKIGEIHDVRGKKIGEHEGVWFYTIGQRKGIEVGGGPALYVIKKDLVNNILTVGPKESLELYTTEINLTDWHWLNKDYKFPLKAQAKIRYRQEDQKVSILKINNQEYKAVFRARQFASAAGQTLAIYKNKELIASAIIQ
jgi:tRNA-specific 2-thiouridylase